MTVDINLLSKEPETDSSKGKRKVILSTTAGLVVGFFVINLFIFGFYWFLTINTQNSLNAVKDEEAKITSLASKERLYRTFVKKLAFLSDAWQAKVKPDASLNFVGTFIVPGVSGQKIAIKEDGSVICDLNVDDTNILEALTNRLQEQEKAGTIKDPKIIQTQKLKEKGYNIVFSFMFLKKE